jgi:diaminopimelate decarboxylase
MAAPTPEEITRALLGFVNDEIMAPGHAIGPDDALDAAGVDSMALLKVLLFVEREFGFWVPDEDLVAANVATAADLGRYVARCLAAR